jgi:hypothetical protein
MEQAESLGIGVQEWSYEYQKITEKSAVAMSTHAKIIEVGIFLTIERSFFQP